LSVTFSEINAHILLFLTGALYQRYSRARIYLRLWNSALMCYMRLPLTPRMLSSFHPLPYQQLSKAQIQSSSSRHRWTGRISDVKVGFLLSSAFYFEPEPHFQPFPLVKGEIFLWKTLFSTIQTGSSKVITDMKLIFLTQYRFGVTYSNRLI
jgi:hypothetical protein